MKMGFVGGGHMAAALVRGILGARLAAPDDLLVADPSAERREVFAALGVAVADDNARAASASAVWLAVKPQMASGVLEALRGAWGPAPLVVSIMAGVTTARLAECLPSDARIVRVMPNTPLLVGEGTSAAARGPGAGAEDLEQVLSWLRGAGVAEAVEETALDAVTALSGSGPAYVFAVAEWLRDAGVAAGLPPGLADRFTRSTLSGAAKLLKESGREPEELRRQVTSPGGTTAAALEVFAERGAAGLFRDAVLAAKRRGEELGRK